MWLAGWLAWLPLTSQKYRQKNIYVGLQKHAQQQQHHQLLIAAAPAAPASTSTSCIMSGSWKNEQEMKKRRNRFLRSPWSLYTKTHLVCFAARAEVGGTVAVDNEAHPHVTRRGEVRAKRREHHLGGISRGWMLFSFNVLKSESNLPGAAGALLSCRRSSPGTRWCSRLRLFIPVVPPKNWYQRCLWYV